VRFVALLWCVLSPLALPAQRRVQSLDEGAVAGSIRWFHDWRQSVVLGPAATLCRGERSGAYQYLYCDPEGVEIDVTRETPDGSISMLHVSRAESLEQVAASAPRLFKGWSLAESTRLTIAPERLLAARSRDDNASRLFFQNTRLFVENKLDPRWAGADAYYPWVFRGDPTYHVYVVRDGKVSVVWEFDIANGTVQGFPSFHFEGRSIPEVAAGNLRNRERWFRIDRRWLSGRGSH